MKRNALPERWRSKLCSKLTSAQSVEEVQAILDTLDVSLLSDNQAESVLRQLLDATDHKELLELVLACKSSASSSLMIFRLIHLKKVEVGLTILQLGF